MKRKTWTPHEDAVMRARYPFVQTAVLSAELGRSDRSVYMRADMLRLKKSAEYLNGPNSGRLTRSDTRGLRSRFKAGNKAWNAGKKGWQAGGRACETQFKAGTRQGRAEQLYQPIGSERKSKDGYLERKVNDDFPTQYRWRPVHLILWEQEHGEVPPGHAVVFVNRDKSDIRLENLELISRAELMRRNSYHRYPKEIAQLIQLRGALMRQINKRESA